MITSSKSIPNVNELGYVIINNMSSMDANTEYVNKEIFTPTDFIISGFTNPNICYIAVINLCNKVDNISSLLHSDTVFGYRNTQTRFIYSVPEPNGKKDYDARIEFTINDNPKGLYFIYNYSISDSWLDGKNVYFDILAKYATYY